MAKIKTSALIDGISGKINGAIAIFSGNRTFLKRNSYSQQPVTPKQTIQRNKIVQFSQLWRTMSVAQKNLWITETANYPQIDVFGNTFYYTGFQLSCFLNANLQNISQPFILSAPSFVAVANLSTIGVTINPGQLSFLYTGNATTNDIVWFASAGSFQARALNKSLLRQIQVDTQHVVNGSIDIITAYTSIFGVPITGQYIQLGYKIVNYSTGNATEIVVFRSELVA